MNKDGGDEKGSPVQINMGKEIDAALGDVIRALLQRPAEEAGNLFADGIGILGDKVKLKRQLNVRLGIEQVKRTLEFDGVNIKDIASPDEEELHLLVNGLSLANDQDLRKMWTGLFAKALEPDSGINAERPFINVLESLSPLDAKVIACLAFAEKTQTKLSQNADTFRPVDIQNWTDDEKKQFESLHEAKRLRVENANRAIAEKIVSYGITAFTDSAWAENLRRQSLIESTRIRRKTHPNPLAIHNLDKRELQEVIEHFQREIAYILEENAAASKFPTNPFVLDSFGGIRSINVRLSPFGRRLAVACGLL